MRFLAASSADPADGQAAARPFQLRLSTEIADADAVRSTPVHQRTAVRNARQDEVRLAFPASLTPATPQKPVSIPCPREPVHDASWRLMQSPDIALMAASIKQLLYVMNPSKLRATEFLVRFHEDRGDKIIIFSDLVYSLKMYAEMLKKPLIYGETPERERQAILGTFRSTEYVLFVLLCRCVLVSLWWEILQCFIRLIFSALRTICISKVGDTSIDLPEANVIIQVSSHFGSRRQEAQRLGRILRPKSYTQQDGSNRSSFNAFFYTLVSNDTQEMFYSAKRQQYLIDQGYTFKIVTNLCDRSDEEARIHNYTYSTPEDDRKLLRTILTSESDLEKEQKNEDNAIRKGNQDGAILAEASVRRAAGVPMSSLSGGRGIRYREVSSAPTKRHPLFRKRQRR